MRNKIMRSRRHFKEENRTDSPIIELCPNYDLLSDINIEEKDNYIIDFSVLDNIRNIESKVYKYFFLNVDEIVESETFELVLVADSKNTGNLFNDDQEITENDISIIYDICKQDQLSWKNILEATEKIKGRNYDISDLQEVQDSYKGHRQTLEEYLEEIGVYTVETNSGFLFFDTQ